MNPGAPCVLVSLEGLLGTVVSAEVNLQHVSSSHSVRLHFNHVVQQMQKLSDMQENIYFLNQAVASWTDTDKTLHQIVKTAIDSKGEKTVYGCSSELKMHFFSHL